MELRQLDVVFSDKNVNDFTEHQYHRIQGHSVNCDGSKQNNHYVIISEHRVKMIDFTSGPVTKTLRFQCRGSGSPSPR